MKLNFIKTNPTENMTVFVMDPLPRNQYIKIANKIMDYSNIFAEQVGFIERPEKENSNACIRLHMMGGEFCGNATIALASALVYRDHPGVILENGINTVILEVSGANDDLKCSVYPTEAKNKFVSDVIMPLHKSIKTIEIVFEDRAHLCKVVEFPGITHLIADSSIINSKIDFFNSVKEKLMNSIEDAFGIMFFDRASSYIEPLVYVKETDSTVWERCCGSGSSAIAVAESQEKKSSIDMIIGQPGGELKVTTLWRDSKVSEIKLEGSIEIVAEGVLEI